MKGAFFGGGAEPFDRDRPIDGGQATYTVAAGCRTSGPARPEGRWRSPRESGSLGQAGGDGQPEDHKRALLGVGGLAAGVICLSPGATSAKPGTKRRSASFRTEAAAAEFDERITNYLARGATRAGEAELRGGAGDAAWRTFHAVSPTRLERGREEA